MTENTAAEQAWFDQQSAAQAKLAADTERLGEGMARAERRFESAEVAGTVARILGIVALLSMISVIVPAFLDEKLAVSTASFYTATTFAIISVIAWIVAATFVLIGSAATKRLRIRSDELDERSATLKASLNAHAGQ